MKFRKKPVVIEAMQWKGGGDVFADIDDWMGYTSTLWFHEDNPDVLVIPTLEGDMKASIGDWVIKGLKGEFYPCKPDIFELTYERYDQDNHKSK